LPATATLRPTVDGAHQLRLPAGVRIKAIRDGRQAMPLPSKSESTSRLSVKKGHVYTIEFERPAA
jgi:hypothetical protein